MPAALLRPPYTLHPSFRFRESPLSLFRTHYEPRAVPRRTERADKSDALQTLRAVRIRPAVAKRLECVRLQRRFPKAAYDSMAGRFMQSPLSFFACLGICASSRTGQQIEWN